MSWTTSAFFGSPRGLVSYWKIYSRYSDKSEVGGSSPPRPTITITSKYEAILTFPLAGVCFEKTICQQFAKSSSRLSLPSIRVVACGFPSYWTIRATGTVVNGASGLSICRGKCAVGV
jgi:hypothetical protein